MSNRSSHRYLIVLTAILLVAAAFRIVHLGSAPPGLQHDEVFHAHDAFTVRQGNTPLWFSSNAGNEPLYIYLMAASTALVGDNVLGIRLTAGLAGLLTIVFTYRWARLAYGERIGLLAAALLAVSFWPVWMSRVGLRVVTLPPLVALTSWLYTRALRSGGPTARRLWRFALAGIALGLTLYTYPAAFAAPLVFAALAGYLLVFRFDLFKRTLAGQAAFWLAAVLAYAPLGLALARAEGGYLRVQQTAIPLQALSAGDPRPLIEATIKTLLMWTHSGDPLWRYNIANQPVFSPALAVIFVTGAAISLWLSLRPARRYKNQDRPAAPWGHGNLWALIPLWLLIGVAPSAVTDSPPAFLRAAAAIPATYIALALGFTEVYYLARRAMRNLPGAEKRLVRWAGPLIALVIALVGVETAQDYFVTWVNNQEVQRVYRADLAVIAAYLRQNSPAQAAEQIAAQSPTQIAISTSEPHHLDPFIFDYTPHGDANIHWFDGLFALVAPAGDAPAWLFITREPEPGERLQQEVLDHLPVIAEQRFPNGAPTFTLYEIPPGGAFYAQFPPPVEQGAWTADQSAFLPDDPQGIRQPLTYPVQLGDVLQLVGYRSETTGLPGQWLRVTLYFQVTQDVTTPEPWVLFMHLLTADGQYAGGRDFLAVPASTWRAGDAFIQAHDLLLDANLEPGLYHLQIGLYSQADGSRFPVLVNGQVAGDRILLEPVEIQSP